MQPTTNPLRRTGLAVLGERPWGTHFCVFYETNDDLVEMLIPYFKAGIENRERCFWVLADSLSEGDARSALDRAIPDADRRLIHGNIEFLRSDECYLKEGEFNLGRVTAEWGRRLEGALAAGYEGIRVSGYAGWLQTRAWPDFWKYEGNLNSSIVGLPMMVLCTYPLAGSTGSDILDVAHTHQCSVSRRSGKWEIIETAALKEAKEEIERLNEGLEQRILERTRELSLARSELARVSRVTTLGELTAVIAHEVNQPLTGLVSSGNACLRWLADDALNLEAARRAVERMTRDGARAAEVISRIRALVSKSPPRRDPLSINEVVTEVLSLVRAEIQRHRISLRTNLADDLPLVLGDRIQLQQVTLNLIINAIESMGTETKGPRELVVSSVKDASNDLLLTVSDSGPGFDGAKLENIFDAFYTTKSEGMGIGLAVSRSIVEGHGGKLSAMPSKTRGAVFQFTLPVREGEP
jgi:signal transduction histidine kinase